MAVAGDDLAQGHARAHSLYDRYYPNVYRYALSQLRSAQDAEDAAQNTFLRAFAAMQKGIVPENEVAWLFKIAHNVCASAKLSWLRRRRVETPRDLELLTTEPAAHEPPREELAGLGDALAAMPPRLREAFLLREWQGLSYAEIAERLDTSRSAVETLIFRARRHLAAELRRGQTLLLGPLANWLRGAFGGGGGAVLRGAGVVALAAGVAAATAIPSGHRLRGPAPQPARAGDAIPAPRSAAQAPHRGAAAATRRHATPRRPGDVPLGRTKIGADAVSTPAAGSGTAGTSTTTAAPPPAATTASAGSATATLPVPLPTTTVPAAPTAATPSVPTLPTATVPDVTVPTATLPAATVPSLTTPSLSTPTLPASLP